MTERARCTGSSGVWRLRLVGPEMPEIHWCFVFWWMVVFLPRVQSVEIHGVLVRFWARVLHMLLT